MKKYLTKFFLLALITPTFLFAQPGGIGNSSTIEAWVAADNLSLSNNDLVSSWTDASGNSNDAVMLAAGFRPTFKTNQINGLPAVEFDGIDNVMDFTSNITTGDITLFSVGSCSSTSLEFYMNTQKHVVVSSNNFIGMGYDSPWRVYNVAKPSGAFSVFSSSTDGSTSGSTLVLTNGNTLNSYTRNSLINTGRSSLGAAFQISSGNYVRHMDGSIAEVIIYNQVLTVPQRRIVSAYLGAKYNLQSEANIYAFGSTHPTDVFGIGNQFGGSVSTADNGGNIIISSPSSLDNNDYLLIGHDGGSLSSSASVPGGVNERWTRVWKADETNDVGTITIDFDYSGSTLGSDPNDYVILVETNDGDFSNGDTYTIRTNKVVDIISETVTFNLVDIPDGAHFTLAEESGDISSQNDGPWNTASTWDCACIPQDFQNVTVDHKVDVDANSVVNDLTVGGGGELTFNSTDTLEIHGDFIIDGSFTPGTGVLSFTSVFAFEEIENNSGNQIDFYRLHVNGLADIRIAVGEISIAKSIQVEAGRLVVTSPDAPTLKTGTIGGEMCQILPSVDGAFVGEFILHRFISPRSANFANISSPIADATVADLDDDLFLSGVGGNNGNATVGGGGTFYSMFGYDAANTVHDTITSTSTNLELGKGYELYLASTQTLFNGGIVGYEGTPNDGDINAPDIHQGWNLMGNPYHCFINSNNLFQAGLAGTFYIYNSSSGSYSGFAFGGGLPIAAGQGFWLDKTSSGSSTFSFQEDYKFSNLNGVTFLRNTPVAEVRLNISEVGSDYNQDFVTRFDSRSIEGKDNLDGRYLPSPIKEVPAITAIVKNSDTRLAMNVVDDYSFTHRLPLELYAGKAGEYEISPKNIASAYEKYSCIYLNDKTENKLIDLSLEDTYTFDSKEGKFDRFELILSNSYEACEQKEEQIGFNQELDKQMKLTNYQGQWYIDYNFAYGEDQRVEISLYNTAGQTIINPRSYELNGSGRLPIELRELNGIYIIRVQSNKEILNQTIHL